MSRGAAWLLVLLAPLLASGCGEVAPLPDADLLVRVSASKTTVHPGEGVALTVTRVWRADHDPAPWDDAALEPLILRDPRVDRREVDGRIEETRRYRAYVFRLEDVQVPELVFASRPKDGGDPRFTRSTPVPFTVVPVVDPEHPGAPELPGAAPEGPASFVWWGGLLLLLVLGFEWTAWRARRRVAAAREARRLGPARALRALQDAPADTDAARAAVVAAVMDALRDHVAWRTGVTARARSVEEITALLPAEAHEAWRAIAGPALAVRFGGAVIAAGELADLVDRALRFVEGDPGGPAPEAAGAVAS